ncbi:hypothetical protein BD410DRAFT_713180 [Rickenella mellea]|uniref:Uncharacterized protein n=1 Tax=Rickenella mellea TaxID=50990 RepID=A0A4Y7QKJ9_9AGAM|nr:hypothetical protein BD410DRAFT_713180 [Rickenella mellea]
MPQVNVTIDDVNPLISYGPPGVWQEVGIGGDDLSVHYFDQTRMGSPALGATASFSFYGSAIWLFGAKRSDHGIYNVTLDGMTSSLNGTGNEVYQAVIFNATGLTLGNHSITLTNAQVNDTFPWVDLDYIIWQTEIGQADDSLIATNIEDTEPAFSYQPQAAWGTNPPNVSGFSNSTGHNTVTDGAFATFSFTGTAVEIFGTVGAANSNYSVQLDDSEPITYNAMRLNFYPQVPLYFATGLTPGNHTLKVTNKPTSPGLGLSIDYASITGTTKRYFSAFPHYLPRR